MRWQLPEGVSTYASTIDNMFYMILVITGIAFVVTEALLLYFVYRYRRRDGVRWRWDRRQCRRGSPGL